MNKHSHGWILDQIKDDDLIISSNSVIVNDYEVKIDIQNTEKKEIYLWMMTCSWDQNFEINNNYIQFYNQGCDKNSPQLFKIVPNSKITLKGTLRKYLKFQYDDDNNFDNEVKLTKIGLIIIDDIYDPNLKMFDYNLNIKDKSKHKIIWSNGINLLDN